MNRREFLKFSAQSIVASLFFANYAGILPVSNTVSNISAFAANPNNLGNQEKLVVVFLRGAMDGLSALVPYGDNEYYKLRPNISIPRPDQKNGVIAIDDTFGLHPSLSKLHSYWNNGTLNFVRSFGLTHSTRSHFDAQDFMESGTSGNAIVNSGWLNRLSGILPGSNASKYTINFGKNAPRIMTGVNKTSSYGLGKNSERYLPTDRMQIKEAFSELYNGSDELSLTYQEGILVRESLKKSLSQEQVRANNGASLPNGFPQVGSKIGKLLRMEPDIHLAFVDIGGWDTHVNQGNSNGQLSNYFKQLALGLDSMIKEMRSEIYKNTTILVMSEFGRTAKENGNRGTDHGHGNIMMVLGGGLQSKKLHGNWEGLRRSSLYQGRDMPVLHDYRSVIGGILAKKYSLSSEKISQVFPDIPSEYSQFKNIMM